MSESRRRTVWGVIIYFFFACLFISTYSVPARGYNPVNIVYSEYSYFILLVVFLLVLLWSSPPSKIEKTLGDIGTVGVILFILLCGSIMLSAVNRPSSLRWVLSPVGWTLLWFLVIVTGINALNISPKSYTSILNWFVISYALISLMAALLAMILTEVSIGPIVIVQYPDYPRLAGWYVNPNRLAPVLVTGALCAISAGINELGNQSKGFFYSFALLFGFGVVLTGGRGPMGALIISVVIYFIISHIVNYGGLKIQHLLVAAGILSGGLLIFGFLLTSLNIFQRDNPFSRFEIWLRAIPIIRSSSVAELLFGHGHRYFIEETGYSPHSDIVRFFINYGLLSVSLLISTGLISLRSLMSNITHDRTGSGLDTALFGSLLAYVSIYMIHAQAIFQVRFSSFIFVAAIAPLLAYEKPVIKLQYSTKNTVE